MIKHAVSKILPALVVFGVLPVEARADETFTYQDLVSVIDTNQVTSIEQLLPLLPQDYVQYYTFVYDSRSSQASQVSPALPRVILYGHDAKLIMAFTSATGATGSHDPITQILETIAFDDGAGAFTFRKLDFSAGSPLVPPPEANPAECQACHGAASIRPNWDPYNTWPGAYGSVSRENCDAIEPGTPELRNYQSFIATNRTMDRYKFLPAETTAVGGCPLDPTVELTFRNAAVADPNADLAMKISHLNLQRLSHLIRSSPQYGKFRYLLAAFGRYCFERDHEIENVESYFPANYASVHRVPVYDDVITQIVADARTGFANRLARFEQNNKGSTANTSRVPVDFLDPQDPEGGAVYGERYDAAAVALIAQRMGFDMRGDRWSTAFSDGTYDFSAPDEPSSDGPEFLLSSWKDPSVPATATCADLQQQSIAALSQ